MVIWNVQTGTETVLFLFLYFVYFIKKKKKKKKVQMVSYQCSPLSTPDGIVNTFRQCQRFQKDKNLDRFVAVVVLDEVGLAEDSPRMPLKALHPLLEDGTSGADDSQVSSVCPSLSDCLLFFPAKAFVWF